MKSPVKTQPNRSKETPTPGSALDSNNASKTDLHIEGKSVPVSNLNKVLYPKCGFTKGQVINYYIRIAPFLMPHLCDRPLTLKRYPDGVDGPFFYEKRCPPYRPSWVKTASMWSERNQEDIHFCVAANVASLVWAVNLADLELHTYLARIKDVDCPTTIVFDLDPGPPANVLQCAEVAFLVKATLDRFGLRSFLKTSGSKGLQLYIPLNTKTTYDTTKLFAHTVAELLEQEHPDLIVSKMEKKLRGGKVLIDWSQNDRHKTTVCVYSLRAKEEPTVSTPVSWEEVGRALKKEKPDLLRFDVEQVVKRAERLGDLFEPVRVLKQKLSAPLRSIQPLQPDGAKA